jgi:hypothetical protein
VRSRRNTFFAWLAAGVLVLSLTIAGMIIYLGRFQGPDTLVTAPAGITSAAPPAGLSPLGSIAPAANGSFGAEPGDGTGDGGLHGRTSTVAPHGTGASTSPNGSGRSTNGG